MSLSVLVPSAFNSLCLFLCPDLGSRASSCLRVQHLHATWLHQLKLFAIAKMVQQSLNRQDNRINRSVKFARLTINYLCLGLAIASIAAAAAVHVAVWWCGGCCKIGWTGSWLPLAALVGGLQLGTMVA